MALLLTGWVWYRRGPTELRLMSDGFHSNGRIDHVDLQGDEHGFGWPVDDDYRVVSADVYIRGRPDALICINRPTSGLFNYTSHVCLSRIGPYEFGESSEGPGSSGFTRGVDFGPGGDLGRELPFEISSINDLIDHYDELVEIVRRLPPMTSYVSTVDRRRWDRWILNGHG
jgi:hypothetical protein